MNIIPIKPPKPNRTTPRQPADRQFPKVIAITSGKGGVGKTNVTSNLAIALARQGNRVCIFDADTSLANINVIMGLTVHSTIEHLLAGEKTVDQILIEGPAGVMVVPAASGIAECANLGRQQRQRLISALESLESRFDYILIDTAAGIGDTVLSFVQSAQYAIVVISTEPTSLTDAFALLRVLKRRDYQHPVYVLVNMALNYANSMEVFKRFEAAVKKYLNMKVHYLGYITEDKALKTSVSAQRPVLLQHPEALASRCFNTLASVLSKQFTGASPPHSFSAYWNDLASAETEGTTAATTGPQSPHEFGMPAGRETPDRVWSQAGDLIRDPALSEEEVRRFLEPILDAYIERFHRLPVDGLERLLSLLELSDYSAGEARQLLTGIESLFERRFQAPARQAAPAPGPDNLREKQDKVLAEFRKSAERIQSEELLLHQALSRLYSFINREFAPADGPAAWGDPEQGRKAPPTTLPLPEPKQDPSD